MEIRFTVHGHPQPKQRPRVTRRGTYTPAKTKNYESIIAFEYKAAGGKLIEGAVYLSIYAYFKIPKTRKDINIGDWHLKRPDLDNLIKIVKDGLNKVAFTDDAQVVVLDAVKMYGKEERMDVLVKEA